MEEDSDNNSGLVPSLLMIALAIGLVLYKYHQSEQEEYYWQQGKNQTCATIYDYSVSSDNNASFYYEYYVDSVRYTQEATDPRDRFYDCEKNKRCIGYRFRVFYAVFKPELSFPDPEAACE